LLGSYQDASAFEAILGSTITLECNFVGTPFPSVKWYMNGTRMGKNMTIGAQSSTIEITAEPYITSYQCLIMNRYGSDIKSVTVHVITPPKKSKITKI